MIDSVKTNANGNYSFTVPSGEYHLTFVTNHAWGGVNSIDGLIIIKDFVGLDTLNGLKDIVADINGDGYLNSIDALLILKRFVGQLNSFIVSDWEFEKPDILVNDNNILQDIKGLCAGDVNGSYIP